MRLLIPFALFTFTWIAMISQPWAAVGDVNYISDELTVPLRSGPSNAHRILHRGLPSGTQLTILGIDEEAGFTRIQTAGGLEGWVTSQYLTAEPIARDKLAAAEKRLKNFKADIAQEREAHANLQTTHKETEATNKSLNTRVEALAKELAELKIVSADPIKEHARNVELTQQNALLVGQVEELSSTTRKLEANVQLQWLLYGGGLVLIGLVFGLVLKKRPKQQTSFTRYT